VACLSFFACKEEGGDTAVVVDFAEEGEVAGVVTEEDSDGDEAKEVSGEEGGLTYDTEEDAKAVVEVLDVGSDCLDVRLTFFFLADADDADGEGTFAFPAGVDVDEEDFCFLSFGVCAPATDEEEDGVV
jgi:hypothetical protein